MDNIMDDLTIEEKFRKRARKFSNICDKMSPQNIEELRKHDVEIDRYLRNISDFIGNSNPYWRVHPMFPNIRCSINGEIEIADRQFEVREHGGMMKVIYNNGRKRYSAADLVMACFDPCPGNRNEYKICYKDGNYQNIKPCNMYWERLYVKE